MSLVSDIGSIPGRRRARRRGGEEVRSVIRRRVEEMLALSWDELDRFGTQTDHVDVPAGLRFRIVAQAFWDMDAWRSEMCIYVRAYSPGGWRRWFPYSAWDTRGGEDEPIPAGPGQAGPRSSA